MTKHSTQLSPACPFGRSFFFEALTVIFIGLRLTGVIAWSWWLVVAPLCGPALVAGRFKPTPCFMGVSDVDVIRSNGNCPDGCPAGQSCSEYRFVGFFDCGHPTGDIACGIYVKVTYFTGSIASGSP